MFLFDLHAGTLILQESFFNFKVNLFLRYSHKKKHDICLSVQIFFYPFVSWRMIA